MFHGVANIATDLGQRWALITVGRFLLFIALLYASGALTFILVDAAGLSIALSLFCTFALLLFLAGTSMYLAGRGCRQSGENASENITGMLQSNAARSTINQLFNQTAAPGLQPMVKTVVDTLVPQHSTCSMTPVRYFCFIILEIDVSEGLK